MIPVYRSKKPKYRYWRGLDYAKCLTKDLLKLYDGETNIAVVQGEPASGLISIDFDEAFVDVAQSFARAAGQNGAGDI